MKDECWFDEEINITMIEKNGGAFIKTNLKAFLILIRSLIDPKGFNIVSECFYCNKERPIKRLFIRHGLCGYARVDHDTETYHWDYCKKCALDHALYLLKCILGEKLG